MRLRATVRLAAIESGVLSTDRWARSCRKLRQNTRHTQSTAGHPRLPNPVSTSAPCCGFDYGQRTFTLGCLRGGCEPHDEAEAYTPDPPRGGMAAAICGGERTRRQGRKKISKHPRRGAPHTLPTTASTTPHQSHSPATSARCRTRLRCPAADHACGARVRVKHGVPSLQLVRWVAREVVLAAVLARGPRRLLNPPAAGQR